MQKVELQKLGEKIENWIFKRVEYLEVEFRNINFQKLNCARFEIQKNEFWKVESQKT